jgi:hypothetical protein
MQKEIRDLYMLGIITKEEMHAMMKARSASILREIFAALNKGARYGVTVADARYPYFDTVLNKQGKFFHWRNYGSSANPATLGDLAWIIGAIFKTTPEKFAEKYEKMDK